MLSLSTPFIPNHQLRHRRQPAPPPCPSRTIHISSIIIPPSYSSSSYSTRSQPQPQIYQPFRPPPSPLPSQYRTLDTSARLEILTNRLGRWFEYAPLIPSLIQEGFTSSTLEEISGIASIEQNRLVVAAQVRDSLVETGDTDTVSFFDPLGSPEILYEIRILSTQQRLAAARFIIANGFDGKRAEELARAIKDFPRRNEEKGCESFDGYLPGDCLGFMFYRQAQEHKSASSLELTRIALERALEVSESERAKQRVMEDLEGKDGGAKGESGVDDDIVKVPVVRMAVGEVAESSVVVVLPVCQAEGREFEVKDAPWEFRAVGDFGVIEAEKGWSRWVVLPGWDPVAALRRGGVAVEFKKAGKALRWKSKKRDAEEKILVVADRERTEVAADDGYYLVVSEDDGEGLKVERGDKLKEVGVSVSLGTVVLVVRPPREEFENQLSEQDWD